MQKQTLSFSSVRLLGIISHQAMIILSTVSAFCLAVSWRFWHRQSQNIPNFAGKGSDQILQTATKLKMCLCFDVHKQLHSFHLLAESWRKGHLFRLHSCLFFGMACRTGEDQSSIVWAWKCERWAPWSHVSDSGLHWMVSPFLTLSQSCLSCFTSYATIRLRSLAPH